MWGGKISIDRLSLLMGADSMKQMIPRHDWLQIGVTIESGRDTKIFFPIMCLGRGTCALFRLTKQMFALIKLLFGRPNS